ncbi:hypothetical protein [Nonomuraea sp. NPDC005650]|uniref:hypothetical protein n=1 Tax=Nonomuraea sp. NPDC005650 TaxID=3157045 RepID=UPI0033ABB10F
MIVDWFRSRRQLLDELTEAREQAVTADKMLDVAVADRDHYLKLLRTEQSKHQATQQLLESLELEQGADAVFAPARPRTFEEELAAAHAHAAALEALVQRLQVANMAADRR